MKPKEYEIPRKIAKLIIKQNSAKTLAEACVEKAAEYEATFWEKVYELFPDLEGKAISYNNGTRKISIINKIQPVIQPDQQLDIVPSKAEAIKELLAG